MLSKTACALSVIALIVAASCSASSSNDESVLDQVSEGVGPTSSPNVPRCTSTEVIEVEVDPSREGYPTPEEAARSRPPETPSIDGQLVLVERAPSAATYWIYERGTRTGRIEVSMIRADVWLTTMIERCTS